MRMTSGKGHPRNGTIMNYNNSIPGSSTRKNDEIVEKACTDFMVRNFWNPRGIPIEVVTDKKRQCKGIDIIVRGKANIDEKVKYYNCLNKDLQAPSVEVLTTDRMGNDIKGWFIKPDMETHAYAFISIYTDETDYRQITSDNINSLTYLLVMKHELVDMMKDIYGNLWGEAIDLKYYGHENINGKITRKVGDFWLTYSHQLREKPVNLVVGRDVLKSLPHTREIRVEKAN